jgi:hydroxymethylpyrimidine pyrophosphatase-like HAD family hydrolase
MPITTQGNSDEARTPDFKRRIDDPNLCERFHCSALATDYDGTLATHGTVGEETRAALRRFRASGRRVILVTGRRIADLSEVDPHLDDFDVIVAENGALLYWPGDRREEPLAKPPPAEFVQFLAKADVRPIERGKVIVATVEPYQHIVLEAIRTFGLELQVVFNKGCVMILPSGVNKATGLKRALKALGIPREEVIGVGDAENDHALLDFCGLSVAVANALPALKERANIVLASAHGEGVTELIGLVLGAASDAVDEGDSASAPHPAATGVKGAEAAL